MRLLGGSLEPIELLGDWPFDFVPAIVDDTGRPSSGLCKLNVTGFACLPRRTESAAEQPIVMTKSLVSSSSTVAACSVR